jgi:hypothetical protein
MLCVVHESLLTRRLEMFAMICGITLEGHKEKTMYNENQSSFFFRTLGIIFGGNIQLMQETFEREVYRLP